MEMIPNNLNMLKDSVSKTLEHCYDGCQDVAKPTGRILFVTDEGNIVYQEKTDRLKSLPWYKKLYAKVNRNYRNKFIDVQGFEIK